MNNSCNTFKFTVKKYVILKKEAKEQLNYKDELEDKIIELSLKLKNKDKELNEVVELNNLIFKKLIHNLKNPVGIAFSFSEMILEGIDNYNPEKLKSHVEIIKNSSDFSLKFLNKLAEYARYQQLELKFTFLEYDFLNFINSVIAKAEVLANKKSIHINKKLPTEVVKFKFDKNELEIAILNILNNAIRYSNENSEIGIEVTTTQSELNISVSDYGLGLEQKDFLFIFDEFCVVNTYSEDKEKCIGLGLPIAQKIVKKHGGKISIKSEISKGSTFTISLPLYGLNT